MHLRPRGQEAPKALAGGSQAREGLGEPSGTPEGILGGGGACSLQITWINLKQGFLSASYKEMSQEVVSKYFRLLFAQEMP